MEGSIFRFKRFSVRNERSAMKVNTDGVILGATVTISPDKREDVFRVLDAGTGTGTIALMTAQRLHDMGIACHILGIDIDEASATEAGQNFAASPWAKDMEAMNIPLEETDGRFSLIVSNPPYFDSSLKNPDERKNTARHTKEDGSLSFRTLLEYAAVHLCTDGTLAMILPSDREKNLLAYALRTGFRLSRILRVKTVERKEPMRIVAEFKRKDSLSCDKLSCNCETLVIQEGGNYTARYTEVMKDFYLWA